jgi:hypothetical protein
MILFQEGGENDGQSSNSMDFDVYINAYVGEGVGVNTFIWRGLKINEGSTDMMNISIVSSYFVKTHESSHSVLNSF